MLKIKEGQVKLKYVGYGLAFCIFGLMVIAGALFTSNVRGAEMSVEKSVSAFVPASCSMSGSGMSSHAAIIDNGVLTSDIGTTSFSVSCNDANGFAIYAVGYSGDVEGDTKMLGDNGSYIDTGTATAGDISNWAMKVTPGAGVVSANGFNNYSAIPANFTRVVEKQADISLGTVVSATSTYQVYPSLSQPAGTYTGQVKYTLVHPSILECPEGYKLEGGVCKKDLCAGLTAEYMQDITTTDIEAMETDVQCQLKDKRDNKVYWVSKLKDGKVWMTQNLDYDLSVTANKSLKVATSDVTEDKTLTITSTWGSSYTDLYYKAGAARYLPNGSGTATNITCTAENNGGENCHYHLGDYYNWTSAVAGTYPTTTYYTQAPSSICPKRWRLPTAREGDAMGDFNKLNNAYGGSTSSDSTLRASPIYFVRSGYINKGSLFYDGYEWHYWSSTVYNRSGSLSLQFRFNKSSSRIDIIGEYRDMGGSVRCVAR